MNMKFKDVDYVLYIETYFIFIAKYAYYASKHFS